MKSCRLGQEAAALRSAELSPQVASYAALVAEAYDRLGDAVSAAAWHERARRLGVSVQGIAHALRRMGITYKKSPDGLGARTRRRR